MKTWTLALLLSAISSSVLISNAIAEETQHTTTPYSVVDGNKLDSNSYKGFKLFRNWCARCHGTYGQGMVGPNLADSLKIISKEEFYATVENGKTGTIGSMPAWKSNEKVMEGRDSLYAYLKARSDGAIGEVKPSKQK
jgi:mono/diheme cytochrome c family protein